VYIKRLEIEDLKLFRDLDVSFLQVDGSPRMWTVLVGENGLGKTTLLRAIALAAVGPDRGNQLADIASLPDRRKPTARPRVSAEFLVERGGDAEGRSLRSVVEVPQGINLLRGASWWLDASSSTDGHEDSPLATAQAKRDPGPEWFVAGYGVERQLPQALAAPEPSDRLLGRMEPLFDKGPIIATGFSDQLEEPLARDYAKLLKRALVESHLLPNISNLALTGRGGVTKAKTLVEANRFSVRIGAQSVAMPATWLSQGYQAMIAWIADLIGQLVLVHNQAIPLEDMQGLALVDELDLFVHPRWQLHLISTLKALLPRMQFVVTTHSPMVLPGLEREEVLILEPDARGSITYRVPSETPKLLTGSEIYDVFFGIRELFPTDAAKALREFAQFAADPDRTEEEDKVLKRAQAALEAAGVEIDQPVPRSART
jgi:hypothetical protein